MCLQLLTETQNIRQLIRLIHGTPDDGNPRIEPPEAVLQGIENKFAVPNPAVVICPCDLEWLLALQPQ